MHEGSAKITEPSIHSSGIWRLNHTHQDGGVSDRCLHQTIKHAIPRFLLAIMLRPDRDYGITINGGCKVRIEEVPHVRLLPTIWDVFAFQREVHKIG